MTACTCIKDCLLRCCLLIYISVLWIGIQWSSPTWVGTATQIQHDAPSTLYVHCLAHCTNLCLQTIDLQYIPVLHALDLASGIADLIRYSPKISSMFGALQAQLAPGLTPLKPSCPTRWTVHTCSERLQFILSNYPVLWETLQQVNAESHDDYGHTAGGYLPQVETFSINFGLKMSLALSSYP